MPVFYFSTYNGRDTIDDKGMDLPGVSHATAEAKMMIGRFMLAHSDHPASADEWRMEVTDERGLTLIRFDISMTTSAALFHSRR